MKSYYRIILGKKSVYAAEAFSGGFVGGDFGIAENLTGKLPGEWKTFNKTFIPIFLSRNPEKTKIAAGLSCGSLWTIAKGIRLGDAVLTPDGSGRYRVGEITGEYVYAAGQNLPHRRPVQWSTRFIDRTDMSEALRNSAGSVGAVSNLTSHSDELQKLILHEQPTSTAGNDAIQDPAAFVLEKHLEDFLVQNWAQTELGRSYDIYSEEGERVGQQYQTDTGPLDILAVSKDRTRLLVVELKKGRASDSVVGQVLRYMGYVRDELAEAGQTVEGAIIALDDDQRIRRALAMVPNVSFFRYEISFRLLRA